MKNKFLLVAIVITFLSAAFISQSCFALMEKVELPQLTEKATNIVIGNVTKIESKMENKGIFTYVTIKPEEIIKGESSSEIVIKLLGGEANGIGLAVSDSPAFKVGEKVTVFLKSNGIYYDVVDSFQGKYTIKDNKVLENNLTLEVFKTQIKSLIKPVPIQEVAE